MAEDDLKPPRQPMSPEAQAKVEKLFFVVACIIGACICALLLTGTALLVDTMLDAMKGGG